VKPLFRTASILIPLLLAAVANAQQTSSFMGIPFGTKYENAKAQILKREGAEFKADASTPTSIFVQGLKWGDYDASVTLKCDEVYGMWEADVWASPYDPSGEYLDVETSLKQIYLNLKAKYGKPIETGNEDYVWKTSGKNRSKIYVREHVGDVGEVEVIYQDADRVERINTRLARHSSDY
jgi:hypothetical protein